MERASPDEKMQNRRDDLQEKLNECVKCVVFPKDGEIVKGNGNEYYLLQVDEEGRKTWDKVTVERRAENFVVTGVENRPTRINPFRIDKFLNVFRSDQENVLKRVARWNPAATYVERVGNEEINVATRLFDKNQRIARPLGNIRFATFRPPGWGENEQFFLPVRAYAYGETHDRFPEVLHEDGDRCVTVLDFGPFFEILDAALERGRDKFKIALIEEEAQMRVCSVSKTSRLRMFVGKWSHYRFNIELVTQAELALGGRCD